MTLIEVLVFIVLLTVLFAVIVPRILSVGPNQSADTPVQAASKLSIKEKQLRSDLSRLRYAIAAFRRDCGAYPLLISDLAAPKPPPKGRDERGRLVTIQPGSWRGPYLTTIPADSVSGYPLKYVLRKGRYDVRSSAKGRSLAGTRYGVW